MKIGARNQIQGTITDTTKGATTSHVRLDVGGGAIITASITNESVDETARAFVAAGARARARAGRGSLQVVVLDLIVDAGRYAEIARDAGRSRSFENPVGVIVDRVHREGGTNMPSAIVGKPPGKASDGFVSRA